MRAPPRGTSPASSTPQLPGRDLHEAVAIFNAGCTVASMQQRPVEVDDARALCDHHARRHGERCSGHAPDHDVVPHGARGARYRQRLGETAGFVQLDIDVPVGSREPSQRCRIGAGLVRCQGNRSTVVSELCLRVHRQRLLDEHHAKGMQLGSELVQQPDGPRLIGIHQNRGLRAGCAHCSHCLEVLLRVHFYLQHRHAAHRARRAPHGLAGIDAEGKAGHERPRGVVARARPDRDARCLGLQIPQGTIDRIARPARRQQTLQLRAREPGFQSRRERRQLLPHGIDRLTCIVDAGGFATTEVPSFIPQRDDQHIESLFHPARDSKRRPIRPPFCLDRESHCALSAANCAARASAMAPAPSRTGSITGSPKSSATEAMTVRRRLRSTRHRSGSRRSGSHRGSSGGAIRCGQGELRLAVEAERWPYRTPFRISRGVEEALDVLVVTLRDERGHLGRGEAAGVDYAGETIDTMRQELAALAPALEAGLTRSQLQRLLPAGGARNAVDCALWDLEAKTTGVSVWARSGYDPPRPLVTCLTLGIDTSEAMGRAARAVRGMPVLKVKVNAQQHLEAVRAVRAACPEAAILVDPNQAWSIRLLNELAPELHALGVVLIEQPLPVDAEAELADYRGPVPLAADESCADAASLRGLSRAYRYVNIKLDKAGGLTEALAVASAARAVGYDIMVGCMAGTSLAMAPGMVVAQRASIIDLDGPLLHARDRTPGIEYRNGLMQVPPRELWG